MIIMVTAQVIAESAMSIAEQQAALLRFGGNDWLKALKKRHSELRTFTVKRALEKERAAKANPEGTVNLMRMHVYGAALVQISKAVNSGQIVDGWVGVASPLEAPGFGFGLARRNLDAK